jgi:ATP-dependent RNA helicase DHX37/DHR1
MAPPPRHERYNAKARGSVAGGSSHKKRKRGSQAPKEGDDVFVEREEPSTAASIALASEMSLQSGMGTKKRKRLESYIVSLPSRHATKLMWSVKEVTARTEG